ncbi:MAG: LPXTG cell wall anchor domain-containing protein, partial [Erysipelotrichaceae bacterium]|nr:LPXTG cell wall anchor domain-containing protein [Erysipelotrichaceae bacterium]
SIIEPKNAEINVCAVPGYGDFITAETVFVKGNLETPASEVKISVRQSNALYYGLAAFALLAIGAMLFLKKKRKKA